FTVTPDDPEHYASLFDSLAQSELLPDRILHMWSLDTHQGSAGPEISGQALAFDSLVQTARAIQLLDYAKPISLTVVTAGSQSVAGEAIPHPERALALGPCRVIPREMPELRARLVDFSSVDVSSEFVLKSILDECDAPPDADLIAYRGRQRWTSHLVAASVAQGAALPSRIRQGGVYLISGGLGDIALDLSGFLASSKQARLALVSRRGLPPKSRGRQRAAAGEGSAEVRVIRRLLACEDAGGEVLTLVADVSDPAAMARVVADCRAHFGVINGVFHAAGALDDGPIATKTAESVRRVLGPKAVGAQVLHSLLPPGDLDFFAVFSSTSVYLGAAGQVDYVAANAFIDALAASRSDGLSIHWGIWGDSGMAARAYGSHALGHDGRSAVHPLLGVQVADEDGAVFEASYSAAHLWVLREHGVAGRPVLPGTAYIEIARAAMAVLHPGAAVEIRALSFEEAMVFDGNAARQVRVELRRTGEGYNLLVRSRGEAAGSWLEHARAGVGLFSGSIDTAPTVRSEWMAGEIPQAHAVAFGPRWSNIERMQIGTHEAVADMRLSPKFAGDLAEYGAHPALTDMAATFGLHLVDAGEREGKLFVPLSIERIRLVAAVPAAFFSHVQRREVPGNRLVSFDASLYAPDGSPIATFEGFSLRGVLASAVTQQANVGVRKEPSLIETMLACGIKGEDASEVFARVLGSGKRDLTVSSIALSDLSRVMARSPSRLGSVSVAGGAQSAGDHASDATLNPVEKAIAEVWRDLLGVQEVAPDDDFFALGGHSLAAVRLFAKIRKQFGVDLPLATLFQAPTLAELSRVVSQSGGLDTSQAVEVLKKISSTVIPLPRQPWSPLVAICKGEAGRTPLFCVHGAGGNVLNFKVISDRLGRDQPFYGLQAQGVDGLLEPLLTIEAMASQYVQAIRTVSASGPYRLAGYSGGGVIAYEMAQQLIGSGAKVEFLGMIDTLSPEASESKTPFLRKLWIMRKWALPAVLNWFEHQRAVKTRLAFDAERQARILGGEKLTPELIDFQLFSHFLAAQRQYAVQPYSGTLVMFRADQSNMRMPSSIFLAAGLSLGWAKHVQCGVRVIDIPGSHFTMMAEPGLSILVEALRAELSGSRPARSTPAQVVVPTTGGAG
ncbi:MAG: KR domain-containing protein, partial [Polaromonas sp.]|nr:KR domain-containing protein [Polaromonas sp.]